MDNQAAVKVWTDDVQGIAATPPEWLNILSEAGAVGVDGEAINHNNTPRHDWSAFGLSHQQTTKLALLPERARAARFTELWTAREAVAKADGRALSLPFSLITIERALKRATIAAD